VKKLGLLIAAALLLAGCAGSQAQPAAAGRTAAGDLSGTLTVFAASSLTDVFDALGASFRAAHPRVDLKINYGPSSGLAQSIGQGAPADVFASANEAQMTVVTEAGRAGDPAVFASNVLEIAVPRGNPGHVTGLADFARPGLTLAVCAPQVPCGAAAEQVFTAAGIRAVPDSQEEDARATLTKVELGEVDAALVYATDVRAAGAEVEGIPFPEAEDAVNRYPIAVLQDAPNPKAAQEFVDLVRSDAGRRALADAGFRTP
jgi:molybdate transport system substrate-binding protein